jgi:hypothetical protein
VSERLWLRKIQRLVRRDGNCSIQKLLISNKSFYKNQHKELLRAIDHDSEYSAAALAYARAEIYKMECGQQVKRQWLEDILNLK